MAARRRASLAMCFCILLTSLGPASAEATGEFTVSVSSERIPPAHEPAEALDLTGEAGSLAGWVVENDDNTRLPFVIVDKKLAKLYVFAPSGQLIGASTVLLGLAVGDASVPGIASRSPASLTPAERTTPAGRFSSEPGHNAHGEDIVWFDYDASLAIHRLRPSPARQRRDERMASENIEDKRISYGCIVVPVSFYEAVVQPLLGRQRGVVYVMPETRPLAEVFGGNRMSALAH